MRILLFKIKQWWSNAKKEYEDSKMQEVQQANNSDLKEWYSSEWQVPPVPKTKFVGRLQGIPVWETGKVWRKEKIEEEYKKAKKEPIKHYTKNKNKTNKKTKKSTLEDI